MKSLRRPSRDDSKRSYSFTEGLLADKENSTESFVGIFSNLPSPTDDGSAAKRNLFPKSEVLFRKEHKETRRKQFANIGEGNFLDSGFHLVLYFENCLSVAFTRNTGFIILVKNCLGH